MFLFYLCCIIFLFCISYYKIVSYFIIISKHTVSEDHCTRSPSLNVIAVIWRPSKKTNIEISGKQDDFDWVNAGCWSPPPRLNMCIWYHLIIFIYMFFVCVCVVESEAPLKGLVGMCGVGMLKLVCVSNQPDLEMASILRESRIYRSAHKSSFEDLCCLIVPTDIWCNFPHGVFFAVQPTVTGPF